MLPRRLLIAALALLVLSAATSCSDGSAASDETESAILSVGSIVSLTGSGAPYGVGQQQGTELAIETLATDNLAIELTPSTTAPARREHRSHGRRHRQLLRRARGAGPTGGPARAPRQLRPARPVVANASFGAR